MMSSMTYSLVTLTKDGVTSFLQIMDFSTVRKIKLSNLVTDLWQVIY